MFPLTRGRLGPAPEAEAGGAFAPQLTTKGGVLASRARILPSGPLFSPPHMSDTTTAAPTPQTPKTSIAESVIRIAGDSQDGIQAIGGFLARLAGRSEQEVMTFMTIPSTISGGPSIFQVRIGSGEVLTAGDDADVLLAFYQHSYQDHITSLKKGGIVLYDSDHVEPNPDWQKDYHHLGVPISGLTVESIGGTAKDKGKNIYALGLIAR